jgi:SAM-dependent methyltransferase
MIKLKYHKVWKEILKRVKNKKISILDIGCRNKEFWKNRPKNLNLKVSYKGVDIVYGFDICKMKLNKKFSIVLLLDVLKHLYNPWKALQNIKFMLDKDSLLIVTVPNAISWRRIVRRGEESKDHLFSFTKSTIKNLLEKAGFKIIKIEYFSMVSKVSF